MGDVFSLQLSCFKAIGVSNMFFQWIILHVPITIVYLNYELTAFAALFPWRNLSFKHLELLRNMSSNFLSGNGIFKLDT